MGSAVCASSRAAHPAHPARAVATARARGPSGSASDISPLGLPLLLRQTGDPGAQASPRN